MNVVRVGGREGKEQSRRALEVWEEACAVVRARDVLRCS